MSLLTLRFVKFRVLLSQEYCSFRRGQTKHHDPRAGEEAEHITVHGGKRNIIERAFALNIRIGSDEFIVPLQLFRLVLFHALPDEARRRQGSWISEETDQIQTESFAVRSLIRIAPVCAL